ncbi:alpha/beta fold hydrolase [Herbaspirillum sp. GCM10030257]|uniref:alpha/beta fold hydrolase n=1 Tax=Herbaspirillum sp. GCM10030257 TaxID=3273393 RepID=UPI0036139DEA
MAYQWIVPAGTVRRRILLCHGITSSHEAYLPSGHRANCPDGGWGNAFIGPGKALDPEQGDMVLCINTLGSWFGSTGAEPGSAVALSGLTMGDMARAQWCVLDHLDIDCVDILIGYSFGGYLAVEMACQQEKRVRTLLQLASGFRGRADPSGVAAIQAMIALPSQERRQAVTAWRRELLERYGYVRWLKDRNGAGAAECLEHEVAAWTASVSLEALLTLRHAAAGFDRTEFAPAVALTAIRWDSDPLFPRWQLGEAPPCRKLTLSSPYGHCAPLAQPHLWTPYLSLPA